MIKRLVRDLAMNEWFTLKPIEEPKESQVWIRGEYDRISKTYGANNYADMNKERFFKGDKEIYVDFTF